MSGCCEQTDTLKWIFISEGDFMVGDMLRKDKGIILTAQGFKQTRTFRDQICSVCISIF